jgi:hypothetical protein
VVDGGAKAAGLDEALRLAAEAARSAVAPANLDEGAVPADAATARVDSYLRQAGATSWSSGVDGDSVIVTVTISRPTKLLGIMQADSWTVTATGRADGLFGSYAEAGS